ncbi:MAG: c-type cytochrome domain-containing protein [Pirellulales bacterium]
MAKWQRWVVKALESLVVMAALCVSAVADEPIPIEAPPADREVDFAADVLPLLQRNCLACHSASTAEGDIVLETPELLRAERDGGALVMPGDVEASRLLRVAAHRAEPLMPPADNDVGAVALKPAELGLLQRWIEQGAKDSRMVATDTAIHWQPVPDEHRPILATAVAPAGDVAVCSRGGELVVYHLQPGVPQERVSARLVDPALDPAHVGPRGGAHLDMVRAVAISRDSDWIATAGFRCVKLWQRHHPSREAECVIPAGAVAASTRDGKLLAVAGEDGTVQLIDPVDQRSLRSWKGHDQPVIGLAFNADGGMLISAGRDGVVRAWKSATGAGLAGWQLSVPPTRLAMPADDLLVTASEDLVLCVWTLAIPTEPPTDGAPSALAPLEPTRALAGHSRQIEALAVVPGNPRQFLSGSVDGTVRLWNADDGSQVSAWIHGDAVMSIDVQGDGSRFVSIGADRAAKVWNVSGPDLVATLQGDYRVARQVEHLFRLVEVAQANVKDAQDAVQTVEKQLATDQEIKLTAVAGLEEANKLLAEKTTPLNEANSKHEASAAGLAELGAGRDQAEKALADAKARGVDSEKELELLAAAVKQVENPDELAAATAALEKVRQDRQAYLQIVDRDAQTALDAQTKQRDEAQMAQDALTKQLEELQKAFDAATAASKDAATILSRGDESIVRTTEAIEAAKREVETCAAKLAAQEKLRAETSQRALEERPAFVAASFSPDGKRLILADDHQRMFVYEAQTFSPLSAWEGTDAALVAGMFVDDENYTVLARGPESEGKLTHWAVSPQWTLARTIGSPDDAQTLVDRVLSVDFSPDGRLLATGSGEPSRSGQIAIWNVADGTLVLSIDQPHSDAVFGLAFSPDGQFLASASADRTMKVFGTAKGELIRTFEGHTDHVIGASWRANGKQLATCGADNKIKIWDFSLGEQRRTIDAGSKEITGLAFFGTGGQLVSSSGDRNVRIHNADDGSVVRTFSGASGYLFCCATTETGDKVVAGGADQVLRVWNGQDGTELFKLESSN